MQDDDDKPVAPASEGVPADDKSADAEKPEGEEPEGEPTETDAATSDEDAGDTDDDKDESEDEGDDEEGDADDDEGKPKRKQSRAQRYRQQRDALRAENEALRSRPDGGSLPPADQLNEHIARQVLREIGKPPKQDDFKDADGKPDYIRFHNAQLAWELDARQTERTVIKELRSSFEQQQARVGTLVSAHKDRIARLKTQVKDYDEVMAKATMPVAPHVERLILESKRSARIGYHLAKDQSKLARLNNMSPEDVARELGRIEGRLSLPPQQAKTKARKPITPLRGGGTGPRSDTAARDAWLKKTYGDRA